MKIADRYLFTPIYRVIQDERWVFFVVVDIIGHCEKKKSPHDYVSNSEWLPRWSCWNENKNMVTQKNELFAVNTILILFVHDKYRSGKFVTFHKNFFENLTVSLNALLQLVNEQRCFVRLSWSSRFFIRATSSEKRSSNSYCVSIFVLQTSLFKQSHKQKFKAVRSGGSNGSFR